MHFLTAPPGGASGNLCGTRTGPLQNKLKLDRASLEVCGRDQNAYRVCLTFSINVLSVYLFSPWLVQMVATAALCCQAAETHPGAGGGGEASTATEPCKKIQAKHKPGSKAAR